MEKTAKIYVAGHRGMVGSALVKALKTRGFRNIITHTRRELDLTNQAEIQTFFAAEKPDYVFLAAARVGGIQANDTYRAEFIYQNMMIQNNIVHSAYLNGVQRLLFLGSSCIYPKHCPQPIKEAYLLSGELEPTNQPYAVAKISGIELCWSYNRQYGTQYLAVMPTNLYGPGDNYHPEQSHVIPGLIRRAHESKLQNSPTLTIWGTGEPRRELLYSEDMADACLYLMHLPEENYATLINNDSPPLINIGTGEDLSITELAYQVCGIVGYQGKLLYDTTKPDGTMHKKLDVSLLKSMGWHPSTSLTNGLHLAYQDFTARFHK
ncbi:MAG: GDP-L-fucose synthase [Pseudomonadota bacterium]